jgi:hypothetical protein
VPTPDGGAQGTQDAGRTDGGSGFGGSGFDGQSEGAW